MKLRFWFFFTLLLSVLMLPIPIFSTGNHERKQVIILDIPRFDLAEITPEYPFLNKFIANSSVGLVTIPSIDYPLKSGQIYLYFNSNSFLKTPPEGYGIYDYTEKVNGIRAADLHQTFSGKPALPGNAINIDLEKLLQSNTNLTNSNLGYFGNTLHDLLLKTAVIGNADTERPNRSGAAMAMDSEGIIDYGAVGKETIQKDRLFPSGGRTNLQRVIQYYRRIRSKADLIVITLGDLERIESYTRLLNPSQKEFYRRQTLRRYDGLCRDLLGSIPSRPAMIVVFTCLQPDKPHIKNNGLTPVIIHGTDFPNGLLYSRSTRKKGHITYPDLRNTILAYLSVPIDNRRQAVAVMPGDWQNLIIEQLGLVTDYSFRWPLLTTYIALLVGLTCVIIIGLILHFKIAFLKAIGWCYLWLLTIPATFLLEGLASPTQWRWVILYTLGISGLILTGAMIAGKKNLLGALGWIALINAILVLGDGLTNGFCQSKSFLGYTAVSGKRYYGIGNEYMGVLMGAYIVFITVNLKKLRNPKILWSIVALTSLIFFHPYLGADVGGGMTAVLGLGITTLLWLRKPIRLKNIGLLLLILVIFIIGIGVWDMLANPSLTSHFGQLLLAIKEKGANSLLSIIMHKLEMSWWLLSSTPLTMVVLLILFAVPFIFKSPSPFIQRFIARYPDLKAGCIGLSATALLGFVFNDSGIVSAAIMFMFGLAMVLICLLEESPKFEV